MHQEKLNLLNQQDPQSGNSELKEYLIKKYNIQGPLKNMLINLVWSKEELDWLLHTLEDK